MNCHDLKNRIPAYLDGELKGREYDLMKKHLTTCRSCRKEVENHEKIWQLLGEYEGIDPSPDYAARFWSRVENRSSWRERIRSIFWPGEMRPRWVPAVVLACVLIVVSTIAIRFQLPAPELNDVIAGLGEIDLDMVASVDILEDYEIIQEIDFFSDLEFIERLDQLDAS